MGAVDGAVDGVGGRMLWVVWMVLWVVRTVLWVVWTGAVDGVDGAVGGVGGAVGGAWMRTKKRGRSVDNTKPRRGWITYPRREHAVFTACCAMS